MEALKTKLVGFTHFKSKDKTKEFYVLNCLYTEPMEVGQLKSEAVIIPVFCTEDQYNYVVENKQIYDDVMILCKANHKTQKLNYKIEV